MELWQHVCLTPLAGGLLLVRPPCHMVLELRQCHTNCASDALTSGVVDSGAGCSAVVGMCGCWHTLLCW